MRMIKPDVQSSVQGNEHFLSKAISPIPCCVAFFHLFLLDKNVYQHNFFSSTNLSKSPCPLLPSFCCLLIRNISLHNEIPEQEVGRRFRTGIYDFERKGKRRDFYCL